MHGHPLGDDARRRRVVGGDGSAAEGGEHAAVRRCVPSSEWRHQRPLAVGGDEPPVLGRVVDGLQPRQRPHADGGAARARVVEERASLGGARDDADGEVVRGDDVLLKSGERIASACLSSSAACTEPAQVPEPLKCRGRGFDHVVDLHRLADALVVVTTRAPTFAV